MSLSDGYTTRPATMDDLDTVHALFLACSLAEHGSPDFSREELLSWWRDEGFDLATDSLLVFAPDGALAGFADISPDPSGGLSFNGRGVSSVGLGVDAQSETGAPQLYEQAGMRMYREWDIYEKSLGLD